MLATQLNVNEASRNGGSPGAHGGVQWYLMGYHPYLQYAYDPMGFPRKLTILLRLLGSCCDETRE